jgi:hypothetical protein
MSYSTGAGLAGAGQQNRATISPVVEHSQIEQRLCELERMGEEWAQLVAGLGVKLQSVLTPQMANEGKGQATPKPVVSALADRLDSMLGQHRHQASILRDIFDRIAL